MNGHILGYDPGGNGSHGVARLTVMNGAAVVCQTDSLGSAEDALLWFGLKQEPLGIGVDTLTLWSTGASGDRPADRWLRTTYDEVQASVMCPNALRGAMCLNGMALICVLRKHWPQMPVCETHPKVLYFAMTGVPYPAVALEDKLALISHCLGLEQANVRVANEHEWDALVSAYAMWQGLRGHWNTDLHAPGAGPSERLVCPAGPSSYYWPPCE